jgi:predicted dienelactone hydrolase
MPSWLKALPLLICVAAPAAAQTPCVAAAAAAAPTASPLPAPTGPFKVGRLAHHLPATTTGTSVPELMLYAWYPADRTVSGRPVPYLAGWPEAQHSLREHAQRLLRDAFCSFEEGRISPHAITGAAVASGGERFPLLMFGHGLGVPGFAYTAQFEELASHGYIVVAVEHAPTAAFVLFPDGRIGSMDSQQWNAIGKLPQDSPELQQFERTQIEQGASALRRALDELTTLDASGPLARRLDLGRVGIFGHSFGAMAAMRASQTDRRLRAVLTQDAFGPTVMANAAETGRQMTAKVGLFFRPLGNNVRDQIERMWGLSPPGTLLVTPASPGFAHMSFSDLLLLRAGDNTEARAAALRNLVLVRALTRTFFDNALKGAAGSPASLPTQGYAELTVRTSAN